MKFKILGSGAGIPSKSRNTQSYILDVVEELNQYFLIDASEALQHRIMSTTIRPSKIKHVFITHLHGDHIFGLPGFLSSRAHQGGEGVPLYIYAPAGLKEWVELTLRTSASHLNYPIHYIEVSHNMEFDADGFKVKSYLLDHAVESYLYVFSEPDKPGALKDEKLKQLGIKPGPFYKDIKQSVTFEFEGQMYDTSEFMNPPTKGRKVAVHGDTRVIRQQDYLDLLDESDLIVHEATYLDGEGEKAHLYHHSEMSQVQKNFSSISYGKLVFSHISNRYDQEQINAISSMLPKNMLLAYDLLEITIPRGSQGS